MIAEATKAILLAHDHAELDELLAGFFSALSAGKIDKSFAKLDLFWGRLAMHIRAEHLHLFPTLLRALETPQQMKKVSRSPSLRIVRSTISRLQEDHDYFMRALAAAVRQLRELRAGAHEIKSTILPNVQKQVIGVSRRLVTHNELEESQVYQWVDVLLEPAERVLLNEKMQRELRDLPSRFRSKESLRSKT